MVQKRSGETSANTSRIFAFTRSTACPSRNVFRGLGCGEYSLVPAHSLWIWLGPGRRCSPSHGSLEWDGDRSCRHSCGLPRRLSIPMVEPGSQLELRHESISHAGATLESKSLSTHDHIRPGLPPHDSPGTATTRTGTGCRGKYP